MFGVSFNVEKSFPSPLFLVTDCFMSLEVYIFLLLFSLIIIFVTSYTNYCLFCSCVEFEKCNFII